MDKKANSNLVLIMIFVLGLLVGYFLGQNQSLNKIKQISPFKKGCLYNGQNYQNGQGFPADDGCNSCSCVDGQVACTTMACDTRLTP